MLAADACLGATGALGFDRRRTSSGDKRSEARGGCGVSTVRFLAGELTFTWDPAKAETNRRKHGITFEEAATVFLDPIARIYEDPDHSQDEPRFLLVGVSAKLRTLVVVHVERGAELRIISARAATRTEIAMFREEE